MKVTSKNILDFMVQEGENNSIFDEENQLFITERSWMIA
jgi:hypothetical protein